MRLHILIRGFPSIWGIWGMNLRHSRNLNIWDIWGIFIRSLFASSGHQYEAFEAWIWGIRGIWISEIFEAFSFDHCLLPLVIHYLKLWKVLRSAQTDDDIIILRESTNDVINTVTYCETIMAIIRKVGPLLLNKNIDLWKWFNDWSNQHNQC